MEKTVFQKKQKKIQYGYYSELFMRLGWILFFYFLSRVFFLVFNFGSLADAAKSLKWNYWLCLFLGGERFDLFSTAVTNLPYITAFLLSVRFQKRSLYRKICKIVLFYIPNITAFAFNYIDIIYSRFTQKRMTFDVFRFMETGDGFVNLIPRFLSDFWYIAVLFAVMTALFIYANEKVKIQPALDKVHFKYYFIKKSLVLFFGGFCVIISIRGGFQLRPISIVTASHYAVSEHYSLVLNTPFTLLKTALKSGLERKNYFDDNDLYKIYQPLYIPKKDIPFRADNVVVFILEGFSLEYSGRLNPKLKKSRTPFLDNLGKMGIMIPAFANGTRSMEGVPAVIAGIPTLMNNEYLTSNYSENQITALPSLLKKEGYVSAFFHGGKNGTMNFNAFTKIAGFDYYYGKNEYNNNTDYDGFWGIYDDRFLEYTVKQLDTLSQPFFASIFTLSSHHPYSLPSYYIDSMAIKEAGMIESVSYTDWSLNIFFKEAAKRKWYKNTLFVFISDHASQQRNSASTRYSKYTVPLVLYHPKDDLPLVNKSFVQQFDVLPSILDLLHYQDSVFAFGKSAFDENIPFAVNYLNNSYQLITDNYIILFDGEGLTAVYNRSTDIQMRNNLINKIPVPQKDLNLLKAFIQIYNNSLIDNRLTFNRYYYTGDQ